MTDTIILNPTVQTSSTIEYIEFSPTASNNLDRGAPRSAPAFIRSDEAFYWSFRWQLDVQESMRALAEGDYEGFDSNDPNDVVQWMLSTDDDS